LNFFIWGDRLFLIVEFYHGLIKRYVEGYVSKLCINILFFLNENEISAVRGKTKELWGEF